MGLKVEHGLRCELSIIANCLVFSKRICNPWQSEVGPAREKVRQRSQCSLMLVLLEFISQLQHPVSADNWQSQPFFGSVCQRTL